MARARREVEAARRLEEEAVVQLAVRTHDATSSADATLERVARLVRKHAAKNVGGITWGGMRKALESKDRALLEKAVGLAVSKGWVFEDGDRVCIATEEEVEAWR